MKQIAFSLCIFFILGIATAVLEEQFKVGAILACLIGVIAALLQWAVAKYVYRSIA